jgi:signal transduction histidine kinase
VTLRQRLLLYLVPIALLLVLIPTIWPTPTSTPRFSMHMPLPNSKRSTSGQTASEATPAISADQNAPTQNKTRVQQAPDSTTIAPPRPTPNPTAPTPRAVAPAPSSLSAPEPTSQTTRAKIAQPEVTRGEIARGEIAQREPMTSSFAPAKDERLALLDQLANKNQPVLLRYNAGQLQVLEEPSSANWWWVSALLSGALLLGTLGIRRSLAPLYRLANDISSRNANHLGALAIPPLPELRPAVNALNGLLEELRLTLERTRFQEQTAKRFAYNASHELRNPLTAARNYLEVLNRHPGETSASQKALEEIRRTERVLSGLLMLTRLEGRGRVAGEPVDLRNFLEANFELEVQGEATVRADRDLLEIAVENLIKNAEEHAKVKPRAVIENLKGSTWLWLEDDGPGFSEELLPRAFEPFVKHSNSTGLGLAIVEAVARVHGGAVKAENGEHQGARVGLRFNNPR